MGGRSAGAAGAADDVLEGHGITRRAARFAAGRRRSGREAAAGPARLAGHHRAHEVVVARLGDLDGDDLARVGDLLARDGEGVDVGDAVDLRRLPGVAPHEQVVGALGLALDEHLEPLPHERPLLGAGDALLDAP